MNRAMRRKVKKGLNKKITDDQYKMMLDDANIDYIERETNKRCDFIKGLFTEALTKSMKDNGLSDTKILKILSDVENEFIRRRENNGKS